MGASTPTCPNASHNRSAENLSYSWRMLGGSSYWHSEPVQHPCRCQSNAVNQRPHEHSCLNGRSGSVMPVSRQDEREALWTERTCTERALDIFIAVRPVASAVSVGLPPSPESRRRTVGSINEQITNAVNRTTRGFPSGEHKRRIPAFYRNLSRAAPIRANRMAWAVFRSMSLMTEFRTKMFFMMRSFTRSYGRGSTGRCFGRSPRARPPAWNRCRPPYRSG